MIEKRVMQICIEEIEEDFGSLKDLPSELANTIANIYYAYFLLVLEEKGPGWVPDAVRQSGDVEAGMATFIDDLGFIMSGKETLPEMIAGLRTINKSAQPRLYAYTVEFILDIFKYRIPNAHEKNGLRRMLERKIQRKKVKEIPNLVEMLNR